jgi:hypothetical protein
MILFLLSVMIVLAYIIYFMIQWLKYHGAQDLFRASIFSSVLLIALSGITLLYMSVQLLICVIISMLYCIYLLYKIIKLKI